MSKKNTRVYVCGVGNEIRLVKAQNRVQALSHIARSIINVKIASQDDLISHVGNGVKVETANDDQFTEDMHDGKAE